MTQPSESLREGENTYPHMCRDEHQEIGYRDSETEFCPLCLATAAAEAEAQHADELQKELEATNRFLNKWNGDQNRRHAEELALAEDRRQQQNLKWGTELEEAQRQLANAKAGLTCGEHPGMSCSEAHLVDLLKIQEARREIEALRREIQADPKLSLFNELSSTVKGLKKEKAALRQEIEEQCLLLGKSGSREALLLSELDKARREIERIKGCDHLDGPYRRILEKNAHLLAEMEAWKEWAEMYADQLTMIRAQQNTFKPDTKEK